MRKLSLWIVLLAAFTLACGDASTAAPKITTPASQPPAAALTTAPVAAPTTAPAVAPTATTAPPTIAKVGERIEQSGIALTIAKVEKKAQLNQFLKAKDGNTFLLAEAIIENTGANNPPYNPLYFKVKDSDGFEANATIYTESDGLKSGTLTTKGDKARGIVAFEIKAAAKALILSYAPLVIGSTLNLRVDLGQ